MDELVVKLRMFLRDEQRRVYGELRKLADAHLSAEATAGAGQYASIALGQIDRIAAALDSFTGQKTGRRKRR